MRYLLSCCWLLVVASLFGQEIVPFRGRVLDIQTNRPIRNLPIRLIDEGGSRTDDDGIFEVPVGNMSKVITLSLIDNAWVLANEKEATRPVPRHADYLTEFYLRRSSLLDMQARLQNLSLDTVRYRQHIQTLKREKAALEARITEGGSNQVSLQAEIAHNDYVIDSLQAQLESVNQNLENFRGKLYEAIAANYTQFLVAAQDFEKGALSRIKDDFLYPGLSNGLREIVEPYNVAVLDMQKRHQSFIRDVETYWDVPTADRLSRVYQIALIDIHQNTILPLAEQVFEPLAKVAKGQFPRVALQGKSLKATKRSLDKLHPLLEELKREATGDVTRPGVLIELQRE